MAAVFPTDPDEVFIFKNGFEDSTRGKDPIAVGFAARFNDAALAALTENKVKNPQRRGSLYRMIKYQPLTLAEQQAALDRDSRACA